MFRVTLLKGLCVYVIAVGCICHADSDELVNSEVAIGDDLTFSEIDRQFDSNFAQSPKAAMKKNLKKLAKKKTLKKLAKKKNVKKLAKKESLKKMQKKLAPKLGLKKLQSPTKGNHHGYNYGDKLHHKKLHKPKTSKAAENAAKKEVKTADSKMAKVAMAVRKHKKPDTLTKMTKVAKATKPHTYKQALKKMQRKLHLHKLAPRQSKKVASWKKLKLKNASLKKKLKTMKSKKLRAGKNVKQLQPPKVSASKKKSKKGASWTKLKLKNASLKKKLETVKSKKLRAGKNVKVLKMHVSCPMSNPNCVCPGTKKQCPKSKHPYKFHGKTCYKISCACNHCPKPKVMKMDVRCPMGGNPNCMCPGTKKQCPKDRRSYKFHGKTCYSISCACSRCGSASRSGSGSASPPPKKLPFADQPTGSLAPWHHKWLLKPIGPPPPPPPCKPCPTGCHREEMSLELSFQKHNEKVSKLTSKTKVVKLARKGNLKELKKKLALKVTNKRKVTVKTKKLVVNVAPLKKTPLQRAPLKKMNSACPPCTCVAKKLPKPKPCKKKGRHGLSNQMSKLKKIRKGIRKADKKLAKKKQTEKLKKERRHKKSMYEKNGERLKKFIE